MKIQRKHLSTTLILDAVEIYGTRAYEELCKVYPPKVVIAAFQREVKAGRLDYGVSIARPFIVREERPFSQDFLNKINVGRHQ